MDISYSPDQPSAADGRMKFDFRDFFQQRLWACRQRIIPTLVAGCLLLALPLLNFSLGRYSELPWYVQADCDACNIPQSLVFIAGGRMHYNHHPGTTMYAVYGGALRMAAATTQKYANLVHYKLLKTRNEAFKLLDDAISIARWVSLGILIAISFLSFQLLFMLTKNYWISLAAAALPTTFSSVLFYSYVVRSEPVSILFLLLLIGAGARAVRSSQPKKKCLHLTVCGSFFGLAMFAKIQVLAPCLVAILAFIATDYFRERHLPKATTTLGVLTSFLSCVLFPYWALLRPPFLTRPVIEGMGQDYVRVFNDLLDPHYVHLAAIPLAILLTLNLAFYFAEYKPNWGRPINWAGRIVSFLGCFALGFTVSIYAVFLPLFFSWHRYLENVHYSLFSTFSNIVSTSTQRGFLEHQHHHWISILKDIQALNTIGMPVLGIPLVLIALVPSICVLCSLVAKRTMRMETAQGATLLLFAAAILLDLGAAFRGITDRYTIYSSWFYAGSIGVWLALKWSENTGRFSITRSIALVLGLVFVCHGIRTSLNVQVLHADFQSTVSMSSPERAWLTVRGHGRPFYYHFEPTETKPTGMAFDENGDIIYR